MFGFVFVKEEEEKGVLVGVGGCCCVESISIPVRAFDLILSRLCEL